MVLKFNNVDQLDNQLNKQMLADYRDQTCSTKDVVDYFNMARLQEHGCDVGV